MITKYFCNKYIFPSKILYGTGIVEKQHQKSLKFYLKMFLFQEILCIGYSLFFTIRLYIIDKHFISSRLI